MQKNITVFMAQCYISMKFYNNMLLQELTVFLACPAVLRISMMYKKSLQIKRPNQ